MFLGGLPGDLVAARGILPGRVWYAERRMSARSRIVPAVLAVLVLGGCSASRTTPRAVSDVHVPVRHTLGRMVVVVQEHRAADVVAVQLWVTAGIRDESPSERGLAHYLEHMLFKGTSRRPPRTIAHAVESVGGRINAATSADYTNYHVTLPAAHAASAIELLADVSVNASLDEAVLEDEKRVVLEEKRRDDDSPRRFLGRRLFAMAFDRHPYGRPVIGEADTIRSLNRETLVSFYRRHYVPESFVLVVVGAIRPDEVVALASRAFGRLPRAAIARLPVRAPAPVTPRRDKRSRPGRLAYLGLSWHGPQVSHAEAPAVALLVSILGQGRSSRLTQALRERLGLVTTSGARYAAMGAAGTVSITAQLSPGSVAASRAEAQHEFSLETAEGRAHALGRAETVWRIEGELAWVGRLRSVTREQIRLATRRYLDPERHVRLALVPPHGGAR